MRGKVIHNRSGQALVEFAIVVPVLLLLLLGIVQMGFLLNGYITVQQAARIAVRNASLGEPWGTTSQSSSVLGSAVNQMSYGFDTGQVANLAAVGWACSSSSTGGQPTVSVTVDYKYPLFISSHRINLTRTYTMVQEDAASTSVSTSNASDPYQGSNNSTTFSTSCPP